MRTLIALVISLGLAAAAHADPGAETNDDELWLGGGARALRSPSANAVTAKNLGGASFGYGRALGIASASGIALWAEVGAAIETTDGTMFQSLSTELSASAMTAGLRARYPLHRFVAASAHVGLGAQRVRLDLRGGGPTGGAASDHGWGTLASAGAALDLLARSRPPFGFGLRVELGYVVAQGIRLTPHRSTPGDVLELPMTELALGSLDLSGPTFAMSLVGQF